MPTIGQVQLNLTCGTITPQFNFHIMPNCPHTLVIGTDILGELSNGYFCLDLKNNWAKIDREVLPLVYNPSIFSASLEKIKSLVTKIIAPRSLAMVRVEGNPASSGENTSRVFVPRSSFRKLSLLLIPCMIFTSYGTSLTQPIVLKQSTRTRVLAL